VTATLQDTSLDPARPSHLDRAMVPRPGSQLLSNASSAVPVSADAYAPVSTLPDDPSDGYFSTNDRCAINFNGGQARASRRSPARSRHMLQSHHERRQSRNDETVTNAVPPSMLSAANGLAGTTSSASFYESEFASGFVNEVTFGFFDGHDAQGPMSSGELPTTGFPALRHTASPSRVSAHSVASARANGLQHLAGGSGSAGPASGRNILSTILLLVLLGVIPSTLIFVVDVAVHFLSSAREAAAVHMSGDAVGFLVYLVSGMSLCLVSTFICDVLSHDAEGSGIPQMKAIMSGFYDKMKPALSLWCLLAKALGLIFVIGGGLPVGWEGPNVHISCIIAHHLSRIPIFAPLRRDRALRMQIMACACAVGLASSFGTPIGGVLYALETTASFYLVPTFWKSLIATVAGTFVCNLLYKTPLAEAFESTTFTKDDYNREQLLNFAVMGIVFGIIGAFFVRCVQSVYELRKSKLPAANRYVLLGVVGCIAAIVQYPLRLFRLDPRLAINEFFSADNLETLSSLDVGLLLLVKFPLIVVSIGLPVPAGVFIPCFLLGSGMGRLYGELLRIVFGASIVPGGYAVVGAAAFTAGVTRALSCAVVIFELTGQLKHMEPTLIAVGLSVIVANSINRSLYDTLIIMKELPFMPHMRRDRSPAQNVSEIMRRDVIALHEITTLGLVRDALDSCARFDSFPIVTDDMMLVGSVRRRSLVLMLNAAGRDNILIQMVAGGTKKPAATAWLSHKQRANGDCDASDNESDEEESTLISSHRPGEKDPFGAEDGSFVVTQEFVTGNITSDITGQTTPLAESHELDPPPPTDGTEMISLGRSHTGYDYDDDYGAGKAARLVPDLSPLVVTSNTLLSQLHFMFVMLMPTHAYVLSSGRLTGVVTRSDLVQTGAIVVGNPIYTPMV
jgi:H+/Cl- antiporter ClcA